MAFEYKSFGGQDASAFGSSGGNKIDYKKISVDYPKEQDEYIDLRVLTDPVKNDDYNKRVSQHEWLRTKNSFALDSKDPNTKFNKDHADLPGKIRYIGTRKCTNKSKEDETCEYCKFVGGRLKEIVELLNNKIYKGKLKEDADINEYKKALKNLTEVCKKNKGDSKYDQYATLEMEFNNLWGSRCQINSYLSVYVVGKGIKLIKTNGALRDKVKMLLQEKKDVTKVWLRVQNNKKNKTKPAEYYLVYEVPEEERMMISEKQLKDLEESDILKVLKSYVEEETPEKQINNLNGIFKKEEPKAEVKVDEDENLTSLDDLDAELGLGKSKSTEETAPDKEDISDEVDDLFGSID